MANRPYFSICDDGKAFYKENNVDFEFFSGFSIVQKQKSIRSLHDSILKIKPNAKILEVSRKSENPLGNSLSAFNLLYEFDDGLKVPLENVFQSSKVFRNGGPYLELLKVTPVEAKRYEKLKTSGDLTKFVLNEMEWPLEPKTMFYDYIYIKSLVSNKSLCEKLLNFDTFTDIEFNPKKSFNCQARSVAICVSLLKYGRINDYLQDRDLFKEIYRDQKLEPIQTSLF